VELLGQLLRETAANGERVTPKDNLKKGPKSNNSTSGIGCLADHGISKDQSSKWQKLAAIENCAVD
jgi:hypothetical protein